MLLKWFCAYVVVIAMVFVAYFGAQVHAESISDLRERAEQGDTDAQRALGAMYYEGDGVPKGLSGSFQVVHDGC